MEIKMQEQFEEITQEFLFEFDLCWDHTLKELQYNQAQLVSGNRLRPQICLWGYLAGIPSLNDARTNLHTIASVSVSIELIHKASLLIDDWVDEDSERHGHAAFHIEYSPQETILVALNMISYAMIRLKQDFNDKNIQLPYFYFLNLNAILDTIFSMAQGALNEIRLTQDSLYDIKVINEISRLETAKIIENSLLIGYYVGINREPNLVIKKTLAEIGEKCGYIFQTLNDLEAYANPQKLQFHKGNVNLDILHKRKNIAVAILYELASCSDKKKIKEDPENNVISLMKKYHIMEIFTEQIADIYKELNLQIVSLSKQGISSEWCEGFQGFIDYVKAFGENRLKK